MWRKKKKKKKKWKTNILEAFWILAIFKKNTKNYTWCQPKPKIHCSRDSSRCASLSFLNLKASQIFDGKYNWGHLMSNGHMSNVNKTLT